MMTRSLALAALLLSLPLSASVTRPSAAASFDCTVAATPFEHAICDNPDLSTADERLAKSFATATGGLLEESVAAMRADQRQWLDYARRACTDDAEPMTTGSYDEDGAACLREKFNARSSALEESRMFDGHRFFIASTYDALPDPAEADNSESYWKVATHELVAPLLDSDDPLAEDFNRFVLDQAQDISGGLVLEEGVSQGALDPNSDTSATLSVKEVAGENRITLEETSYWFGHGAAHGQPAISYRHYFVPERREVVASDIFSGKRWEKTLTDAAWAQLQAQHADWLMIESAEEIADIVVHPARWDLSDDYGLVIQFEPYEVAAYAYGAPTITIPWDKLETIAAENQNLIRFGF